MTTTITMALVTIIAAFAVDMLGNVLGSVTIWLLRVAARVQPNAERERRLEEWEDHLRHGDDSPLTRLMVALLIAVGGIVASFSERRARRAPRTEPFEVSLLLLPPEERDAYRDDWTDLFKTVAESGGSVWREQLSVLFRSAIPLAVTTRLARRRRTR